MLCAPTVNNPRGCLMALKIGTTIGMLHPRHFLEVVLAAERLGYESLWMLSLIHI